MVAQIASVAIAIVFVAALVAATSNGNTAKIIDSATSGFANSITAALGKGGK